MPTSASAVRADGNRRVSLVYGLGERYVYLIAWTLSRYRPLDVAWQVISLSQLMFQKVWCRIVFLDAGEQPEYNTIDASLWFIHAIGRYLDLSHDAARVREVAWPAVKQILDGYRRGTRYGIRMDRDGLITGGVPGLSLPGWT